MTETQEHLVFNGINGATGDYLLPPLPAEVIGKIARGERLDRHHLDELRYFFEQKDVKTFGPKAGVNPSKLEEAGWGVIFAHDASLAVREALQPLLKHRQAQAGRFYKECSGPAGYRTDPITKAKESKVDFLARHGAGPGPADPDKVPYYLLIVGDPESIPFRFQYQLDVQYAVGRIAFEDVESYANYAESVVRAEMQPPVTLARKAVFFGTSNAGDSATSRSATELVEPLAARVASAASWNVETIIADSATKAALADVLGGPKTPSFLFTATHGIGFPKGDRRQAPHQGALLCQDWPGPSWKQPIPEAHYFSRDDLGRDASVFGLIAFFFACYGAGTPREDDFAHAAFTETRPALAPEAFLAGLPRRLLAHPRGGALAVVGHVDRVWSHSFRWKNSVKQLQTFESALHRMLVEDRPLGSAMDFFNERYAELSTHLTDELQEIKFGKIPDDFALAGMWTANNDSRSYVILGDPAVRLAVAAEGKPAAPRIPLSLKEPPRVATPITSAAPPAAPEAVTHAASAPEAGPDTPLASVIAATEKRYKARADERSAESYGSSDQPALLQQNPPQRIRKRLARLGLPATEIAALFTQADSFAVIRPPGPAPSAARVALERIIGRNDLIGVEFLQAALDAARCVGHVLVKAQSGRLLGHGSGVMVSPRLFLTNNHVLGSAAEADASEVEFGYQYEPGGRLLPGRRYRFAAADFFLTEPALDFTLVAVRAADGLDEFEHVTLADDDGALLVGEYVNIVQHPNGRPKQLAFRDNQVTDLLDDFIHYRADTEPGSSGSPVFSDQWQMVALHHSGVPKRDGKGQILARDGMPWKEVQGDFAIDWVANEGARVGRILAYVRDARLDGRKAPLCDGLFSSVAARDAGPVVTRAVEARRPPATAAVESGAAAGISPGVTVTIPLNVTVSLGVPAGGAAMPAAARPAAPSPAAAEERAAAYVPPPTVGRFSVQALGADTPDWNTHLALALASHLAYADAPAVVSIARGAWGLQTCEFVEANATRCFIASTPGLVLISFRGTVDVANWLSNLNVFTRGWPYGGTVHRGFFNAFVDVRALLERRLDDFADLPIMLTGHSLGGALATVAAAEWHADRAIRRIHTFGQPAVGNSAFRDFMTRHYPDSFFRFVNDDDIVPRVPPGFSHVGRLIRFDKAGNVGRLREMLTEGAGELGSETMSESEFARLQADLRTAQSLGGRLHESARIELEGFWPSISDHSMDRYVEKTARQVG